jgi:hypothetical protein
MRRPDWLARLRQTVQAHERAPFTWANHCGLFTARCVDAVTGSSWAPELEQIHTRRDAAAFLKREGGIAAAVTRRLGPPTPGRAARRGDICQVGVRAIGTCTGATVRAFTKDGLDVLPLARVSQHWRVA